MDISTATAASHQKYDTSMYHVVVMEIVDSLKYLLDSLGGVFFRELAVLADSIEKFSTSRQLGHNVIFVLDRWSSGK